MPYGKCDICGKENVYTDTLRERYETKEIKEACTDCIHEVNKVLDKFQSIVLNAQASFLKQFIINLRSKKEKETVNKKEYGYMGIRRLRP